MFTGIIREIGTVEELRRSEQGARLRVSAGLAAELAAGDSVSVGGACLTVTSASDGAFEAEIGNQTLSVTSLGGLVPGASVNLEPPLRAGDPLGGHLVQGHVDGVGEVVEIEPMGEGGAWLGIRAPAELRRYLIEKGSVCVDGVSLTVASLDSDTFAVALIPHTLEVTTLGSVGVGDPVNLEVDLIAKYVEALLEGGRG